jgi:hypothetical protein
VVSGAVLAPDAFEELEVLGLAGDHLFLFEGLLFVTETDKGQLAVQVVFFLKEAVHLAEKEFLSEGLAVGLELSYFVERVGKVRLGLQDLLVLVSILLDEFLDALLQFSHLDVGEAVVGVED